MRGEEEKETGSAENERTASEILISSEEEWLGRNKLDKLDENSENHQKYQIQIAIKKIVVTLIFLYRNVFYLLYRIQNLIRRFERIWL